MRYSALRILKEALTGHKGWTPAWRDPEPQKAYDYIIVGGGGHGLATAYYLAKEFKQARIALVEKGVPTRGVVYAPAKGRLFYTQADGRAVEEAGPFAKDVVGTLTPLSVATPDEAREILALKGADCTNI